MQVEVVGWPRKTTHKTQNADKNVVRRTRFGGFTRAARARRVAIAPVA